MKYDNLDILIRPGIGKKLDEKFYQNMRKIATRTVKLPPGLSKYAVYYDKRAEWPASPYYSARVKEHLDQMEGRHECEESSFFTVEAISSMGFKHPFLPGLSWEFDESDPRVKQVLKKAGACPIGGTKGENLPKARQYVDQTKSQGLKLEDRYSTVMGVRTQPGPPGEGKARSIEMVSTSDWSIGVEAFGNALARTDANIKSTDEILLFHIEPSQLGEWFAKFDGEVVSWLSWDWTAYDSNLAAQLMEAAARYLIGDYEYANSEIDFLLNTSIMGSWGTVTRFGAMISGHISTNVVDSLANIMHFLKVLESLNLLRFVVCILVNGDDIVIGFSTQLTPDNLEKIDRRSFMSANVSKVDIGSYIWSSKLIIEMDITGKIIISRIPELVYNRIKYPERRKDKLDKWIISMGMASTLEGLVIKDHEHPKGSEILSLYRAIDNIDINTASDEELMPSAEILASDLSWRGITSAKEVIDFVRSTRFVTGDY
jgi:hypothetical protein